MALQDLLQEDVNLISRPIDYRKITEGDFPDDTFIIEEAENLQIDDNGYLSESIKNNITDAADLTIVNVETGRGKTYAILQKVEDFYHADQDYLIIVASPTKPLVNKYFDSIKNREGIDSSDVMHYQNIPKKEEDIADEDISKKIQVLTINMLLGNPGESFFEQKKAKRVYQEKLRNYCNQNGRKVILILDEIHEGVYNFQPRFYPNLLKWKDLTHKVIVLSATYSEPSFPVLRKLAGLTDMDASSRYKIKLIEFDRQKKDIQADLELLFVRENYSHFDLGPLYNLKDIIKDALEEDKRVNILCYSKKLSESLAKTKTGIGSVFKNHGGLNVAVADKTNKRFDSRRHNIGTTFKSGIDITNENSLFIIIPPPSKINKNKPQNPQEFAGIFTNGANEVIQAVGRLRKGGKILIVIPEPTLFIDDTYFDRNIEKFPFKNYLDLYREGYRSFHRHKGIIQSFYDQLESRNKDEIDYLNIKRAEKKLPDVHWHTFDEFLLKYGQKYLTFRYASCGFKVHPFIIWAAYNDQFANCTLQSIRYIEAAKIIDVNLKSDTIIEDIIKFYQDNTHVKSIPVLPEQLEEEFEELIDEVIEISEVEQELRNLNDLEAFEHLLNLLKIKTKLTLDDIAVKYPAKKTEITRTIIQLVRVLKIDFTFEYEEYTREDYILDNIIIAINLNGNEIHEDEQQLVLAYQKLNDIRYEFFRGVEGKEYLPVNYRLSGINLQNELVDELKNIVDILTDQDYFFRKKIYSLRLEFKESDSEEDKKGRAYKLLTNIFLGKYNEREEREERRKIRLFDFEKIMQFRDINHSLNMNFPKSFSRKYEFDEGDEYTGLLPSPGSIISEG